MSTSQKRIKSLPLPNHNPRTRNFEFGICKPQTKNTKEILRQRQGGARNPELVNSFQSSF